MTTSHNITRQANGRKFTYSTDGVIILEASSVLYTHASLYIAPSDGRVITCFHKSEAAAAKGSADGNRYWERIPGVFVIEVAS